MTDVAILGAGVMGSAMAMPATTAGLSVALIGTPLDAAIIEAVQAGSPHPRLKVAMPPGVTAHGPDAFAGLARQGLRLVVLGVSSPGVDWAIERLAEGLQAPVPVLMITKGLSAGEGRLEVLPSRVAREVKRRTGLELPVLAVGGPCIAGELAALRDTSVVMTGPPAVVADVRRMLSAPYYHSRASTDVVGVEICAAFKNFYALAVGAVTGLLEVGGEAANGAKMHNLSSSVFTEALREMAILIKASGGDPATAFDLAGAGDLYVTCQAGRNSRMGRLLGLGLSYTRAKAEHMAEDTVEGAQLALDLGPTLDGMMAAGTLPAGQLPLMRSVLDAVCRDQPLVFDFIGYHGW